MYFRWVLDLLPWGEYSGISPCLMRWRSCIALAHCLLLTSWWRCQEQNIYNERYQHQRSEHKANEPHWKPICSFDMDSKSWIASYQRVSLDKDNEVMASQRLVLREDLPFRNSIFHRSGQNVISTALAMILNWHNCLDRSNSSVSVLESYHMTV